jgi:signal transduction histidine kinase
MVCGMHGSPPIARRRRWTASPRADVALAVVLGLAVLPTFDTQRATAPAWVVVPVLELTALPLAVRRSRPLAVLALTLAAAIAGELLLAGFQLVGPVIALYTVAAHCDRRTSLAAAAATALALVIPAVGGAETDPIFVLAIYAVFAAAWALGDGLQARSAYLRELEARAERLERDHEERARRAVAEERARIARELHDVISHNVSVMVVQASAGGDVFTTRPDDAREALGSIAATGREALVELRRLLGVVRPPGGDDGTGVTPQPGLSRLPELIEQVTRAGLRVELSVAGRSRALPAGVDLSAYRIVQEALTNTLKHAHARRAEVALRYTDASLELEVLDDGSAAGVGRGGHGIIGMRERAALLGGELSAGPRQGDGFAVRARLPLGGPAA